MCWTTTMAGALAGRAVRIVCNAPVPPVEAPIATIGSVGGTGRGVRRGRMTSAVSFSPGESRETRLRCCGCDDTAARKASPMRTAASLRATGVSSRGLLNTSAAPSSSAFIADVDPESVWLEQTTTGSGRCAMIRFRKASPSILGSSRSSRTTSGRSDRIRSTAWNGSPADPNSVRPGSDFTMADRAARTAALSSTIRTLSCCCDIVSLPCGTRLARPGAWPDGAPPCPRHGRRSGARGAPDDRQAGRSRGSDRPRKSR